MTGIEAETRVAEGHQFALFPIEGAGINAAKLVVFEISEVPRPKQETIATWEKNRPAVGLVLLGVNVIRDLGHAAAVCIHPPYCASGIGRVDDHTPAAPATATRGLNVRQHLRSATRNRYFQQFAVGEKCQIRAIW